MARTLGTGRLPLQTMHGIQLTIKNSLCAWPDRLLPSCPAWAFEKFLLMNSTGCGTQPIICQRMFRWLCGGRGKAGILSQGADGRPMTWEGTLHLQKLKCGVFLQGCPVSKVENSRTDTSLQGSPIQRELQVLLSVRLCKKNLKIFSALPRVQPFPTMQCGQSPGDFVGLFLVLPCRDPIVQSGV